MDARSVHQRLLRGLLDALALWAAIKQVVGRVAAGKTKRLAQIITGAPGVGKPAPLGELKKRWGSEAVVPSMIHGTRPHRCPVGVH